MPQFLVLRCSNCHNYKVQQHTANGKWSCPRCDTKQSVQKIYFSSAAAAQCREALWEIARKVQEVEERRTTALLQQHEEGEREERAAKLRRIFGGEEGAPAQGGTHRAPPSVAPAQGATHHRAPPAPGSAWDAYLSSDDEVERSTPQQQSAALPLAPLGTKRLAGAMSNTADGLHPSLHSLARVPHHHTASSLVLHPTELGSRGAPFPTGLPSEVHTREGEGQRREGQGQREGGSDEDRRQHHAPAPVCSQPDDYDIL